jgi:hypothetical protein
MGWKSPNFIYGCDTQPKLKLLLRNYSLSDDIAFRFSNQGWADWPLTGEKYLGWLKDAVKDGGDVINLFMDYETFGEHQNAQSGIFDFMRYLPEIILQDGTFRSKKLAKALEAGDKVAEEAVDRACDWLAVATGNMINTISPDLVIYGGGVIEALGDLFLGKILAEVDRYCMPQIRSTVDIKNASLGDDSILYGALAMIKGL